jgi:chaperonin GroEL (HSP60 family)
LKGRAPRPRSPNDAQPTNLERMLADAVAAAAAIMEQDRIAPGYAVAVVRNVIMRLSNDDATSLIKRAKPLDPSALIG